MWENGCLVVAGRAARFRMHVEGFFQLLAEVFGGLDGAVGDIFFGVFVAVVEIVDFLKRAEMLLRCAVAIKAPAHGVRLGLIDDFHLVHVAVAALAGNPPVYVGGVIEIDVVWSLVDAHPLDRLAVVSGIIDIHRLVQWCQLRAILLHVLVAVPTGIAGRHVRVPGDIHEGMAITAIKTELINVNLMRKRNRLRRLIANHLSLGRRVVTKGQNNTSPYGSKAKCDFEG